MKRHASGYWYQFLLPRRITIYPTRIYRWLNFYWRLKDEVERKDQRWQCMIVEINVYVQDVKEYLRIVQNVQQVLPRLKSV